MNLTLKPDLRGKVAVVTGGAGGNNPRANTDKEYFELGDMEAATKSFFDIDEEGFLFRHGRVHPRGRRLFRLQRRVRGGRYGDFLPHRK